MKTLGDAYRAFARYYAMSAMGCFLDASYVNGDRLNQERLMHFWYDAAEALTGGELGRMFVEMPEDAELPPELAEQLEWLEGKIGLMLADYAKNGAFRYRVPDRR